MKSCVSTFSVAVVCLYLSVVVLDSDEFLFDVIALAEYPYKTKQNGVDACAKGISK
jgi:hypothetical protein